jgi:hypothetical protein
MSRSRLNSHQKTVALLAAALLYLNFNLAAGQALHVAHYNAVELKRESATSVQFVFALNLPQALHAVLAPHLAYPNFLQSYADLSDPALDKEIDKASAAFSATAFFNLPSGAKAKLKHWQWPARQAVREAFKVSLMLLNMPPGAASHLDPMPVLAQARTRTPFRRVQLQLPLALYPIVVSLPHDKFWLTEQIPWALVELP